MPFMFSIISLLFTLSTLNAQNTKIEEQAPELNLPKDFSPWKSQEGCLDDLFKGSEDALKLMQNLVKKDKQRNPMILGVPLEEIFDFIRQLESSSSEECVFSDSGSDTIEANPSGF